MQQHDGFNNYPSVDSIFQVIQDYHQLHFSGLLKAILAERQMSIIELYQKLQIKGYCLSMESLYRYFNSSRKSHRFPSRDFVEALAKVLQLTEEQTELLIQFWTYSKMLRKRNFC